MRHFYDLPQDDGSRRIHRCPPSHHEMALPPHLAQASAQAPRPSHPTTDRTMSSVQVSPYQQRGSTMPSAISPTPLAQAAPPCRSDGWMAPSPISFGASTPSYSPRSAVSSASMGGEYFPTARRYMPSVEVTRSSHPTAIVEWAARACADEVSESAREILAYWDANASPRERTLCWEKNAGPPLSSRLSIRERLLANAQSEVRRAQWVCTYLAMSVSPSHPHYRMGGISAGLMAPSPATTGAAMPSPSSARPSPPARSTPSHPKRTMGGSSEGSMAPSSAYSRTAMPSPSLASPSSPARSSPSLPIIMGEGASLAQHRAATVLQCWKRHIWLRPQIV